VGFYGASLKKMEKVFRSFFLDSKETPLEMGKTIFHLWELSGEDATTFNFII
jgi:hypothetical protein